MKKGSLKKVALTLAAMQALSIGSHSVSNVNAHGAVCKASTETIQRVDETGKVIYDNKLYNEVETPKSDKPDGFLYNNSNIYVSYDDSGNVIYFRYNPNTDEYSPISIFDNENRTSVQYGANQNALYDYFNFIIKDELIWAELQKYYPVSCFKSEKAAKDFYKEYFNLIKFCGCGFAAAIDSLFLAYEGKEQEFEETFGYPMYVVDNDGKIDFNYEVALLQFFNYSLLNYSTNLHTPTQVIKALSNGMIDFGISLDYEFGKIREYLKEYAPNVSISNFTMQRTHNYHFNIGDIVACENFDLYKETPAGYKYNTFNDLEAHYVYVVGFTDDGRPIVSSWGEQYIFDNNDCNWTYKVTLKLKV